MTQEEKLQQEIERTLQSLDGIKRAEANAFLFTRIKARMNKKSTGWESIFSFISKPVVAIVIVLIVMGINGWALWSDTGEEIIDNGNVSELATEYNSVASVNNYDYENMSSE